MSFAAMANGVQDQSESDLWSARVEVLLQSMRDYVRSGGLRHTTMLSEETKGLHLKDGVLPTGSPISVERVVVPLHSFSVERGRKSEPDVSAAGVVGRGGPPDNLWVAENVGIVLCEAMSAYRKASN